MKKIIVIIVLLASFGNLVSKEDIIKNKRGISATLQSQQLDINLPFRVAPSVIISPSFGMTYIEDISKTLILGTAIKFYKGEGNVKTFWGPHVTTFSAFDKDMFNADVSLFDLAFGLGFGGEYFFSDNFSVGIEAQFNIIKSDDNSARFGNPGGISANTGTLFYATIWF